MQPMPSKTWYDEERLGMLAMKFRSTRDEAQRNFIAAEYTEIVNALITSGCWGEMPAFEDQLPDDWMPKSFNEYWLR